MLLIGKAYKEEKERLYIEQECKCLLCKRDLDSDVQKNHLDHDHDLTGENAGKVRGLLCPLCNAFEGIVKHKFQRSGLKGKDVDYITWLKSLTSYLEKEHYASIHPQFIVDKSKWFSRLSKQEMIEELNANGFKFIDGTREKLVPQYKKALKASLCK
ncbi:endonuclease VII [Pseudomonas phage PspYZU05]|uniref:Recombination endonuclease VII n=1 Tax=Pseudomonas phage PspYZU05 TaxID=1983556 RepID=A0A2U7N563_9CAUD|nr:endonuclease VII [Pseudomonas phage PspYZU05]ASD52126.1 recombination endonuclease VII [Pseudomonas phage PspYZU05]